MPAKAKTLWDLTRPKQVAGCVVVCGPPGAGKTTWANEHAQGPIWDWDVEAALRGYGTRKPWPEYQMQELLRARDEFIKQHMGQPMCVIVASPHTARRIASKIGAKVVQLGPRAPFQWTDYDPEIRKRYGRRHARFRKTLLDAHLQECMTHHRHPCEDCWHQDRKPFAVVTLDLHHIRKVDDHPELQYDAANVMFLCKQHHSQRTRYGE